MIRLACGRRLRTTKKVTSAAAATRSTVLTANRIFVPESRPPPTVPATELVGAALVGGKTATWVTAEVAMEMATG